MLFAPPTGDIFYSLALSPTLYLLILFPSIDTYMLPISGEVILCGAPKSREFLISSSTISVGVTLSWLNKAYIALCILPHFHQLLKIQHFYTSLPHN